MRKILIMLPVCFLFLTRLPAASLSGTSLYQEENEKLLNWLMRNRDASTGLVYSHVGDQRFVGWVITYDSAAVTLACIAMGKITEAKKILDFYINTPQAWRLGGIIEAVSPVNPALGEDWSVRTGSNLWIGIAGFHLFKAAKDDKYLQLSKRLASFALSLQNNEEKDINYGGIRLGPMGEGNVAADQHIGYDVNKPSFYEIFATEHSIDAYALFNFLYLETKETKYKDAGDKVLGWLKRVAFNKEKHRFNRGYNNGIDSAVASDIHSWALSALGSGILDTFEEGLAEKMADFLDNNCLSEVSFVKSDNTKIKVKGVDFVDKDTAKSLGRGALVSPEWTFQLVNAYRRLESDYNKRGNAAGEKKFRQRKQDLIKGMLNLALDAQGTLSYPYATQAQAAIGHEYNTPCEGNLSAIGAAYAILALSEFDPLVN